MKRYLRYILLGLVVLLILIQFIQIDKTKPESDPSQNIIAQLQPPQAVAQLMKQACYDCHSHETVYPWYTYIQPVGWWIKHHIDEGREHLNFSLWGTYTLKRKDHKLEEIAEEVKEGHMPLKSYTWIHAEARLTNEQRQQIVAWAEEARQALGYQPEPAEEQIRQSGENHEADQESENH